MITTISSPQNEYIKSICRLNSASGRKETGLFLVEGCKLCHEAIISGWEIEKCLVTEKELHNPILSSLKDKIILISDSVAKKISTMDTSPGVFLVVKQKSISLPSEPKFILALDHLSDPSNLGAILRSAEAFGTDLVFLSEGCVDLFSPKVIRSAMGSVFRVPTVKGDIKQFIETQKRNGKLIIGAGLNKNYSELQNFNFNEPSVIIIGNEANGISDSTMELCDNGLFIPMLGKNESLNAAVAASIILWEHSKWK